MTTKATKKAAKKAPATKKATVKKDKKAAVKKDSPAKKVASKVTRKSTAEAKAPAPTSLPNIRDAAAYAGVTPVTISNWLKSGKLKRTYGAFAAADLDRLKPVDLYSLPPFLQVPCDKSEGGCGAEAGQPCVTKQGRKTATHRNRREALCMNDLDSGATVPVATCAKRKGHDSVWHRNASNTIRWT